MLDEREAMQPGRALAAPDRAAAPAWAALLGGAGLAWAAAVGWEPPLGPTGFLAGWTLMMAAMMLPSIGPLVLLHRGSRTLLAGGYAAAWGALGLLPYAAMEASLEPPLALTLAAAGLYELSPLKSACLRRCRDAAGFLMARYRSGPFRLGVEHGLWCAAAAPG